MNIAYFVNHYPKVSHTFIRREIRALERRGLTVARFSLRGWDDVLPDAEDREEQARTAYVLRDGLLGLLPYLLAAACTSPVRLLRTLRAALAMSRSARERSPIYHLIYAAEACKLLSWLKARDVQHIHAHFGTNSAEVVMLARILGGPPYSFTVHGPDEFLRPMGLATKVEHASFVVAISNYGRSQLYLLCPPALWHRVAVVHCGLENSFFEGGDAGSPDVARLVCVGRLTEAKGQLLLVDALAQLLASGIRAELVLAGDGPMRAQIERRVQEKGCGAHVRITGWISSAEVKRELQNARALVLPSFAEGLPVVIMEALALRRPVLTTYIAGIPELVRDGHNGWLFPAGSVDDLTQAMAACLAASAQTLRQLGECGQRDVAARHSIDTEAAKLEALFRRSLSEPAV